MEDLLREHLCKEFAGVLEEIRERKWQPFCEAARQSGIEPYVALSRVLVRIVEEVVDGTSSTNGHLS